MASPWDKSALRCSISPFLPLTASYCHHAAASCLTPLCHRPVQKENLFMWKIKTFTSRILRVCYKRGEFQNRLEPGRKGQDIPGDKSGLDSCIVLSQLLALEIPVLQLHLPEVGSYKEKWGLCPWALGPWLLGASSLRRHHQGPTILRLDGTQPINHLTHWHYGLVT